MDHFTVLVGAAMLAAQSAHALAPTGELSAEARAQEILDRSHAVYAGASGLADRMVAVVDDGSGRPERSSMEVLLGPADDVTLISGELGVAQMGGTFFVFRPSPGGIYWSGPALASIEASQTNALGAEGSGLPLPAALSLRRSGRLQDLVHVLTQGAMADIAVKACRRTVVDGQALDVIEARGEIGEVTVRFDEKSSLLHSSTLEVSLSGGDSAQRIVFELRFEPRIVPRRELEPLFSVRDRLRVDQPSDVIVLSGPHVDEDLQDLRFTTLDGDSVAVTDLRGRVVVLDFWATWCVPCRAASEQVGQVLRNVAVAGSRVAFYAVNTLEVGDEEGLRSRVETWWSASDFGYETLLDVGDTAARALRIGNLPLVLVVDRAGRIVWAHAGYAENTGDQL
ncbi:MAG TPA: TlpA disulfide reductase family protein, partial [Gammaproteobacteria bacterium]|nr:TlpA disulfide reductase family protein [Gammaproteobacteria bacterium]